MATMRRTTVKNDRLPPERLPEAEDAGQPSTPPPHPVDASSRSAQQFMMDVVVRNGDSERRATAKGRDIYAFTAPLVVEAAERLLDGRFTRKGTAAPGELFDARDFLASLKNEVTVVLP